MCVCLCTCMCACSCVYIQVSSHVERLKLPQVSLLWHHSSFILFINWYAVCFHHLLPLLQLLPDLSYAPIHPTSCSFSLSKNTPKTKHKQKYKKKYQNNNNQKAHTDTLCSLNQCRARVCCHNLSALISETSCKRWELTKTHNCSMCRE